MKKWFKKKYQLSITDARYLTATEEDIMEEFLDELLDNYINEYASDPVKEEIERGRIMNPNYDHEQNIAIQEALKNIQVVQL